ncbi:MULTISPECIES: N-acetylmuramoyl-L-alanine amidase [unclassified Actinobaculum]|uniref:N-acetylmuramoyl-L-alanine amidase n=1 Tax=unclassified Actinobaculum TaxID=2609299 RepID=UPI000D5293B9|nr:MULTISPECIES: N-acetylmuramoyl-L-alanine amidase [unclassified Actinobaculum]AWE41938.1 hypothetical protein DDD63_03285 [Actinobaculum sp. 313]RTE50145.1 hypothetical protein EKN07_02675 [Actinobaculum sp. 352]
MNTSRTAAAASALSLLLGSFIALPAATGDDAKLGGIAIELVTSSGVETDVARSGFDGDGATEVVKTTSHVAQTDETVDPFTDETATDPSSNDSEVESGTGTSGDDTTDGDGDSATTPAEPQTDADETDVDEPDQSELEEEYALFTDPIAIDAPFAVAGLTWDSGDLPIGSAVEVRTLDGAVWSDWYVLPSEDSADGRPGTEYYISGASTGIQVRISRGDGDLPAGLRIDIAYDADGDLVAEDGTETTDVLPAADTLTDEAVNAEEASLISSSTTADATADEEDVQLASVVQPASAAPAGSYAAARGASATTTNAAHLLNGVLPMANSVNIKSRSAWGADESVMTWTPQYAAFQGVIVHHTAGSNNYTQAQVPSVIKGIYRYHAVTRGWGDIGYNVLIDKYGGRWEGRSGTLSAPASKMVIGAHAVPRNSGTMGVSVMGLYTEINPSTTVIDALVDVIAWKFVAAGVDPNSTSPLTVPASNNSPLVGGTPLPRISGHKDVANTACPGNIYNYFGTIRSQVSTKYKAAKSGTATTPTTPAVTPGCPTSSTGKVLCLGNGWNTTFNSVFQYGVAGDEVYVGDWNGNGQDTPVVRRGATYYFRNSLSMGSADKVITYGKANDAVVFGDWNGDGIDTPAVRRGNAYYIRTTLSSGPANRVITFGRADDDVLVGDWNGDGKDTLAVHRGNAFYLSNTLATGKAERIVAYGTVGDKAYAGKFNGQRGDSLAVRRGTTLYVTNTLKGGQADRTFSYGTASEKIVVGDWNRNGTQTFGIVH